MDKGSDKDVDRQIVTALARDLPDAAAHAGARPSAEAVVPYLLELVHPTSVVDVGCGVGSWLAVFSGHGVTTIAGVDCAYVRDELAIPESDFVVADISRPLIGLGSFDLVVCLEVAEHLPPEAADVLVDNLVGLGALTLFSAATPGQEGPGHINLRWPDFWSRKFEQRGQVCADVLRDRFWEDARISWWYRQNMLLFGTPDRLLALSLEPRPPRSLTRPELVEGLLENDDYQPSGREALASLWRALRSRLQFRRRAR